MTSNLKSFWRMKKSDAVATGLLLVPFTIAVLAMAGFVLGFPIGRWHFPVAFALVWVAVWNLAKEKEKITCVGWTILLVLFAILIAMLNVGYTNADADSYHRPATILLANGWNPLFLTEVDDIRGLMGGGFRPWHVAFLPRMGWVFGAVAYRWLGFVEIADAFNFILLFASVLSVRTWLSDRFGIDGCKRWLMIFAICISPVVAGGLFGGSLDAGGYSASLIAMTAADRKQFLPLVLAVVVMAGLKFTGAVLGALIFTMFAIFDIRDLRHWIAYGIAAGILILIVNSSPYLTNIKNHGGPFYPSHSFVASERFQNEKNPITYDFGYMNDDARQLGYCGRFVWAYVSQNLVKAYYRCAAGRPSFDPDFKVSGGVGGFGSFFRLMFCFSVIGWLFVRNRSINVWLSVILASVLIQPTFYCGYARYVPQFYLFPWLVAVGIADRYRGCVAYFRLRWAMWGGLAAFAVSAIAYPASFFALQWIVSMQNLQLLQAARNDKFAVVVAPSLYMRTACGKDNGISPERVYSDQRQANVEGLYEYSSYFSFGKYFLTDKVGNFYKLNHIVSRNDPSAKASRNSENIRFFIKEFLPRELPRLPLRFWQVVCLRVSQFMSARR